MLDGKTAKKKPFDIKGKKKSKQVGLDFIFLPPKSQIDLYFEAKFRITNEDIHSKRKRLKSDLDLTHPDIDLPEEVSHHP